MPTDMGRKRAGICGAAALLVWSVLVLPGCAGERAPLYVDGEAVTGEELALLDGDAEPAIRMRLLRRLAAEPGEAEPFSFEEMLRLLEEENRARARKAAAGEPVYGVLEYTPLQYYSVCMADYERTVRDRWISAVSREELLAYYEAHLEDYRQIGEITADVQISLGGRAVNRREVVLNAASYRTLSEENEALVYALEEMQPGEVRSWTDEQGLEWTAACTGRTADTYEDFDEVKGAVSEQWAGAKLEEELAALRAACVVRDDRE